MYCLSFHTTTEMTPNTRICQALKHNTNPAIIYGHQVRLTATRSVCFPGMGRRQTDRQTNVDLIFMAGLCC
jgi:hypothetical protein